MAQYLTEVLMVAPKRNLSRFFGKKIPSWNRSLTNSSEELPRNNRRSGGELSNCEKGNTSWSNVYQLSNMTVQGIAQKRYIIQQSYFRNDFIKIPKTFFFFKDSGKIRNKYLEKSKSKFSWFSSKYPRNVCLISFWIF